MKINPLNSYNKIYDDKKNKDKAENKEETERKKLNSDSLELSEKALSLNSVKDRIKEGFYNNSDVLDKVSEKLLKSIENKI